MNTDHKLSKKAFFETETILVFSVLFILLVFIGFVVFGGEKTIVLPSLPSSGAPEGTFSQSGFKKFTSAEEFRNYLQNAQQDNLFSSLGTVTTRERDLMGNMPQAAPGFAAPSLEKSVSERVSETNVQVKGIDEPDIVKTDGKEIYFSSQTEFYPILEEKLLPPSAPQSPGGTRLIKAFPVADLGEDSKIDKNGDLLLANNMLVIFSENYLRGYNVSDSQNPKEEWSIDLGTSNALNEARLYKNKIYLITSTRVDSRRPCPITPFSSKTGSVTVRCADIYHPVMEVPVDVTYTAMVLDPQTGRITERISFVGSSQSSVIYMSNNALYVTYSYYKDMVNFFYDFFNKKGRDLIPNYLLEDLNKLADYDISQQAKITEFQLIFERYKSSLSDDEQLRIDNELSNRMNSYFTENKRNLEKTGIVKIDIDKLNVSANGEIPGRPLNQFSLDEYNDFLRIATTLQGATFSSVESANDIYVLNNNLRTVGTVQDIGLNERIYSVRFIEDKGYVVTFRETDPFFVFDLSNPNKPEMTGELKIPGYSSYLHPLAQDLILGIGKENSQVKLSLFDVSNKREPVEAAKYLLDEYWSDVLDTHHAFLLDQDKRIFFLPGSKGGYVFSYQGNELILKKGINNIQARRAVFINDYLYIIGDDKLVVLNEIDWERVNQLDF